MSNDTQKRLQQAAAEMLPDTTITMGLMEHQMDLLGHLIVALAERAELSEEDQKLVETLRNILQFSSVDFNNLDSQLQSYKFPKVIEGKKRTRLVQTQYLQAQLREGIFDN